MATYRTPGVYVEEISTLPPSVAEVATAVPAFIGYSEAGKKLARVTSMLEFEQTFGKAKPTEFIATTVHNATTGLDELQDVKLKNPAPNPHFLLYYATSHYFKNGGGPCYVVSVGDYTSGVAKADLLDGLALLAKEDEPTLIVLTDAVLLAATNYKDYIELAQEAPAQSKSLMDRFVILDVPGGDVDDFRNGIDTSNLSFGAAYHPYLETSLTFAYEETGVEVKRDTNSTATASTMDAIKDTETSLYNAIKDAMGGQRVILPPSAAVAGIYAQVDRDRGVWKAPANVSVSAVVGPVEKITDADQESLNIDPAAGKSINAIRAFSGAGTKVWGARTLAGNDNEWRYVPVRRLFITIEESTRKSSAFAVFEPNDATTWLKVKSMIESYVYDLWQKGALAGSTPDAAYYVSVGLGKTMTSQDVLEGRMIVEIGVAAVRPAEFIVLRFTHMVQEA